MVKQPKQRHASDEQAMYILNLKYGLKKTYVDIEKITGISKWVAAKICNRQSCKEIYDEYWRMRNETNSGADTP